MIGDQFVVQKLLNFHCEKKRGISADVDLLSEEKQKHVVADYSLQQTSSRLMRDTDIQTVR